MKFFFVSSISFLTGILFHSLWYDLTVHYHTAHIFLLLTTLVLFLHRIFLKKYESFQLVLIGILFFVIGVIRFNYALPQEYQLQEPYYAYVVSEPEHQKENQRFVAQIISPEAELLPVKILVTTNSFETISYGDLIHLDAHIDKPEPFIDKRGKIVHYDRLLASRGVRYLAKNAKVTEVFSEDVFGKTIKKPWDILLVQKLYSIKYRLLDTSYEKIPEPESGLLAGILYGKLDALSWNDEEVFRRVGLMHIVVLSGYNVAIIIEVIVRLLGFLERRTQSIVAIVGVILFSLLVGGGPTVVRASAMAIVLLLARFLGRKYNLWRSILLILVILVAVNPYILVYSLSFQLSFLATIGIVLWHPIILWYLQRIPNILEFRDSLATTLSAQIMVTPLILYMIGDFSLIAPFVNTIVLFAVPIAMLLGFLSSFEILGEVFSHLAYLPLHYIVEIARWGSKIPHALLELPRFSWIIMALMYFIIWIWYRHEHRKNTIRTTKI
jgi:competence protein ComEC